MYDLKAYAIRREGVILAKLTGNLPDSCHSAAVVDKYPGGNIVYVRDPGEAQIFISEQVIPGSHFCTTALVPWSADVRIQDDYHEAIGVYLNGEKALDVVVGPEPEEYQVIALLGHAEHTGCSVIPADAVYPMIYHRVFGPADKAKCETWMIENCCALDLG